VDVLKSASAFYTKPNASDLSLWLQGTLRVVLFPWFVSWWSGQLGFRILSLYLATAVVYVMGLLLVHSHAFLGRTEGLVWAGCAFTEAACEPALRTTTMIPLALLLTTAVGYGRIISAAGLRQPKPRPDSATTVGGGAGQDFPLAAGYREQAKKELELDEDMDEELCSQVDEDDDIIPLDDLAVSGKVVSTVSTPPTSPSSPPSPVLDPASPDAIPPPPSSTALRTPWALAPTRTSTISGGGIQRRRLRADSDRGDPPTDSEGDEDGALPELSGSGIRNVPMRVAIWDQSNRVKTSMTFTQLRSLLVLRSHNVPPSYFYQTTARWAVILAVTMLPLAFRLWVVSASLRVQLGVSSLSSTLHVLPASGKAASYVTSAPLELPEPCLYLIAPGTWSSRRSASDRDSRRVEPHSLLGLPFAERMEEVQGRCQRRNHHKPRQLKGSGDDGGDAVLGLESGSYRCTALEGVIYHGSMALATFVLSWVILSAFTDAERTLQRRLAYAKFFTALTSSGRARRLQLPHFTLKHIHNIKVWLSLRAGRDYLKQFWRQRVTDAVVTLTFYGFIALMVVVVVEFFSTENPHFPSTLVHWELLTWWLVISVYLLRFMMLGIRINRRYRNFSVLLTEQMNVQLRILASRPEEKEKRERLAISSKVLELAIKLLKEFESPNQISGLAMDPVVYNVTRVILFSALSAAMSELMGFDVKMWKLKGF